jgi:anti-sigma B factor antagonist
MGTLSWTRQRPPSQNGGGAGGLRAPRLVKSGAVSMGEYQRIQVTDVDNVAVVRFTDRKILDELIIQDLGQELFSLVADEQPRNLLLNFTNVDFLSSAALGKLISLHKKVERAGGVLKLSNIKPEIYDVFKITRLNEKFDIKDEQEDALAEFASAG